MASGWHLDCTSRRGEPTDRTFGMTGTLLRAEPRGDENREAAGDEDLLENLHRWVSSAAKTSRPHPRAPPKYPHPRSAYYPPTPCHHAT